MGTLFQTVTAWWPRRSNREPTAAASAIWDTLSHVGELGEPAYVSAFADELGYRLWGEKERTPEVTPAQFVEYARNLLAEHQPHGAGFILDLTPDLKKAVLRALPRLAAAAGGARFERHVSQLLGDMRLLKDAKGD